MTYKKTNEGTRDEHAVIGGISGKKVFVIDNVGNQITSFGSATITLMGLPTVSIEAIPRSFYQNISLVSGYNFYGNAAPGSNPTTSTFRLQRETLLTGEVLFGDGVPTFKHQWSATSMPSISYT